MALTDRVLDTLIRPPTENNEGDPCEGDTVQDAIDKLTTQMQSAGSGNSGSTDFLVVQVFS